MVKSTENVMKMKTIVVKKVRIIPHSNTSSTSSFNWKYEDLTFLL